MVDDIVFDMDIIGGDVDVQEVQICECIQKCCEGGQILLCDVLLIFGNDLVDIVGFCQVVECVYEDLLQYLICIVIEWWCIFEDVVDKKKKKKELDVCLIECSVCMKMVVQWLVQIVEWGLWVFVGVLVVILLLII